MTYHAAHLEVLQRLHLQKLQGRLDSKSIAVRLSPCEVVLEADRGEPMASIARGAMASIIAD